MEETLQHETTTQRIGLPPSGPPNHRPDGPKAGHALTIKLDHSRGADHCGQAQKSITVKHEGISKLANALRSRHEASAKEGASRVLKGDLKLLAYFVDKSRKAKVSFQVIIVQPSVSAESYSPDMAKLLANTELFLKRTTEAEFRFIGS